MAPILFSVLDLCPIADGSTAARALQNSLELARDAERLGYHRYWVAEHHNIPGVASAATAVVIGHIAGGTTHLRVGSGGIMLPNHAPLVIAEQFGTLESLYPGRIDLGLGRAPGGDQATAWALRRNLGSNGDTFPRDVAELQGYLADDGSALGIRAIPGRGTNVPLYLLGSSTFSARLAAEMGLPFAFAAHFAPDHLAEALELYRTHFQLPPGGAKPHVMLGVNVIAAESDEAAARLFTTLEQLFLNLIRGQPREMPAPVDSMDGRWSASEEGHVRRMLRCSVVGGPAKVRAGLEALRAATGADEFVTSIPVFDHAARRRSLEITADVFGEINRGANGNDQGGNPKESFTVTYSG